MIQLETDENIVVVARKHWMIFVFEGILIGGLALLPLLGGLFSIFIPIEKIFPLPISILFFLYILWLLVLWMTFFYFWTDHYLDILLVTNARIIEIEQKGLFHREISSFRLDKIQDITVEIRGILGTFLDYGDIHVQTAGEGRTFILENAARPEAVKKTILEFHNRSIGNRV